MFRRHRGFTLIELLVVIAIIAILAAILFPVFAQAKNSARTPVPVQQANARLRANLMYSSDWEGAISDSVIYLNALAMYRGASETERPCSAGCSCYAAGQSQLYADDSNDQSITPVYAWCIQKVWTDTFPLPCTFYSALYIDFVLVGYHYIEPPVGEPLNPNFIDDYKHYVTRSNDHEISYVGNWLNSGCGVSGGWFHYIYLPAQ